MLYKAKLLCINCDFNFTYIISFFRYATFFVVGVVLILLVFLFLGYHNFYKPVRSEQITPPRSSGKHSEQHENNGGHYEMRPGNGVILASST
jgi:hypothetical protein